MLSSALGVVLGLTAGATPVLSPHPRPGGQEGDPAQAVLVRADRKSVV